MNNSIHTPDAASPTARVLALLKGVKEGGDGWKARCPAHDDRTPSLSVTEGSDGKVLLQCFAGCEAAAVVAALGLEMSDLFPSNGSRPRSRRVARQSKTHYDYRDAEGTLLYRKNRKDVTYEDGSRDKRFWATKKLPAERVLYRLQDVLTAIEAGEVVWVVEGEKDADNLAERSLCATTNFGGAEKWRNEYTETLQGARVVILPDNDNPGRKHAAKVVNALHPVAEFVRVVELPGLPEKGDVSDWLDAGGTVEELTALAEDADPWEPEAPLEDEAPENAPTVDDFWGLATTATYIDRRTGEIVPAGTISRVLGKVERNGTEVAATTVLMQDYRCDQMTWYPGRPEVIEGVAFRGGFPTPAPGVRVYNQYRPPAIEPGDPEAAGPWVDHVRRVFPEEADHVIKWLASKVQHPDVKVNHALVLWGEPGTGKDTILEGVVPAVGKANVAEASPVLLLGRFTGFLKSVLLRVSEGRDLGDHDRYHLYEHTKTMIAAPPEHARVDEKYRPEYYIPNVVGVVFTTNHRDGLYLPANDRRHFVAKTELTQDDFEPGYFEDLYGWYEDGGYEHIAAYLRSVDLTAFDSKAPPPKTEAFWEMVEVGRTQEDDEVEDALEQIKLIRGSADAITLTMLRDAATPEFREWLEDRKNYRKTSHRLDEAGYTPVRNPYAQTSGGRWRVGDKKETVYARKDLTKQGRIGAAETLAGLDEPDF